MTRSYSLGTTRRLINALVKPLTRLGLAGRHTYILRVRGRNSGRIYETPVTLVEDGERYLVAPYGEVGWVRNARAAGEVELRRAGRSETLRIEELEPAEAAPALKRYLRSVPVVRPFFDAKPNAPLEQFEAEAARHPVFRLTDADEPD